MRVRITANTSLPGGFVIEAENDTDIFMLRTFASWPQSAKECGTLVIANHGGNVGEGKYSLMIHYSTPTDVVRDDMLVAKLEGWIADPDTIPQEVITETRDAISREFGNNGTDGYYKRILAKVFSAIRT